MLKTGSVSGVELLNKEYDASFVVKIDTRTLL